MEESGELSIRLLIDKKGKRVLFAEADKDCVDFLFYILSLPLSTIVILLGKQQGMGANLYQTLIPPTPVNTLYRCCYCVSFSLSNDPRAICSTCSRNLMNSQVPYTLKYMVMDDLTVNPLSPIAALKQFNIKDVFALEEREVKFGITQALKLLKAFLESDSLESDKVLTTVFLNLVT